MVPLFLDNAYYMRIAQQIAFYTIAAIGLNILVGYQGQVSLGHGGLFAVGAYTSALLATRLGVPVWICLVGGAALRRADRGAGGAPDASGQGAVPGDGDDRLQRHRFRASPRTGPI